MLFFMFSLITGVVIQIQPGLSAQLTPLFWHSLMVGWITQIIIGVSLWMFPGRSKTEDYRSQFLSWVIFGTLNIGLILRVILEPFSNSESSIVKAGIILSAVLQVAAAFGYFIEMWPRVISKEKQLKVKRMKGQAR
jgi:cytochrome bd-type quinol oxidase subunit 2